MPKEGELLFKGDTDIGNDVNKVSNSGTESLNSSVSDNECYWL